MDDNIFLMHILEETEFLLHLSSSQGIETIITDPVTKRAIRSSLETI